MKLPLIKDIILFEDEHLLILNKPPQLVSDQDNAEGKLSLKDLLHRYYPNAMLCHRLDKETSGAIIAAKDEESYRMISIKFQKREIDKEYHALVRGAHSWKEITIDLPIRKAGAFRAVIDKNEGKRAQTLVSAEETFKDFTLVSARPFSGRFHQVRIHLASVACPLVGDTLYGGKPFFLSEIKRKFRTSKNEEELPMMDRAALHARALRFEYPEGKTLEVIAPYPKDYEITLKMLRKFNAFPGQKIEN